MVQSQLDVSLFGGDMKGGWNQKHIHPVGNKDAKLLIGDAPDKSDDRMMPVLLNRSAEPVIVEYDPEEEKKGSSEENDNMYNIDISATMKPLPEPHM